MKSKRKEITVPEPSKSEMEILQVLWDNGPSTVRFVNQQLNELVREVQYTSTLKTMQLMTDKGLLYRDDREMQHVYSAAVDEAKTKQMMLSKFVDTIYKGSSTTLMMQLLGSKKTSKKELDQIRELLKKFDKK